jgi:rubrerythrin
MSTATNARATAPIVSIGEFLVHALELEHESVERYEELAQSMEAHNNLKVAELFRRMAAMSEAHAQEVQRRAAGIQLPQIPPWDFKWHCPGSPEMDCGQSRIGYMMTAIEALEVAQLNEARSRDFYAWVAKDCPDPLVRKLATEMAAEEEEHVQLIDNWLGKAAEHLHPQPEDLDPPNIQG